MPPKDLPPEDKNLWLQFCKGVKPLEHKAVEPDRPKAPLVRLEVPRAGVMGTLASPRKAPATIATTLDRQLAAKISKGLLPLEGTLDLHGMTQNQAQGILISYVLGACARKKRLILVITGKGKKAGLIIQGEGGVLRRCVPEWLASGDVAPFIISVTPALPQHGGDGALYVYLRRNRGA